MVIVVPYLECEVAAGEAASFIGIAGWTLTSVNTRLWLTEEKGGRDIWLLPGDRHRVADAGKVVVEPWGVRGACAAKLRLAPPSVSRGRFRPWPGSAWIARPIVCD